MEEQTASFPSRPRLIVVLLICLLSQAVLAPAVRAEDKPSSKKSIWKSLSGGPEGDTPASVAGVRGLEKTGEAADPTVRDYPAVDRLEKVEIKPEELTKFRQEGHLR